jgi:hypothetical protein
VLLAVLLAAPARAEVSTSTRTVSTAGVLLASAGLSAVILGVGTQAWWDDGLEPFRLRETGFLGRETYAGGADKVGHMYSAYAAMALMAASYEALGMEPATAAWASAAFTGLLFNGFEVIDGFTRFGFEYGDALANTLGIGLGLVTHLVPGASELVGMRLGYSPSLDFLRSEKNYLKFVNDYSGAHFYLDLKGRGVASLLGVEPGPARFVVGGLVYGSYRYSPIRVREERQRLFGVHLGIDVAEVLRARAGDDRVLPRIASFLDYFALPFFSVALMTDLNGGGTFVSFGVSHRAGL